MAGLAAALTAGAHQKIPVKTKQGKTQAADKILMQFIFINLPIFLERSILENYLL